jgi:hypothetical protein
MYHFVAGAGVSTAAYIPSYHFTGDKRKATVVAIGSTLLVGLTKELIDQYTYGGFDWKDLACTMGGGLLPPISFNVVININDRKRTHKIFKRHKTPRR